MKPFIIILSACSLLSLKVKAQTLQTVTDNGGNTTTNPITIAPVITATTANTMAPALTLNTDYRLTGSASKVLDFSSIDGTAGTYTNISPSSITGSGSGLTISITVASASPKTAQVTITNAGSGYNTGDAISIPRSAIGSATSGTYTLYIGNVTNSAASYGTGNAPLSINPYTQGIGYTGAFTPMFNFDTKYRDNTQAATYPVSFGYYYKTSSTPYWAFLLNNTYVMGFSTTYTDIPYLYSTYASIDALGTGNLTNSNGVITVKGAVNTAFIDNSVKYSGSSTTTGASFIANQTIVAGAVASLTITNAGSGYTPGSYTALKASGGSGTGLTINITVGSSGTVTAATVGAGNSYAGSSYAQGDNISATIAGGSGFTATVVLRTNNNFSALANVSTFKSTTGDTFYTVRSIPTINQSAGATGNIYGFFHDPRITSLKGKNIAFQNVTGDVYMGTTSGNVGIGTSNPTQKLSVAGTILAKKVKVSVAKENWPDYVFDSTYQLRTLEQVDTYIQQNKHLPDVSSAESVAKNGLDVTANQAELLKKVEELTLYMIEQNKQIKEQEERIKKLEEKKK